jgi:hypothetical protein
MMVNWKAGPITWDAITLPHSHGRARRQGGLDISGPPNPCAEANDALVLILCFIPSLLTFHVGRKRASVAARRVGRPRAV